MRISFETPAGERMGIVAYLFRANSVETKNRPSDEHRFQVKYGSKDGRLHALWFDPFGVFTTLFLGVDPDRGIFVGADPVVHSPTRFFISVEFKRSQVDRILKSGWYAWERERRTASGEPIEVLVGGTAESFLDYVRFERAALGLDQGHRQLLAEKVLVREPVRADRAEEADATYGEARTESGVHALASELALSENEVLDLIASARRLKMAVRGWVAEKHLVDRLRRVPGVTDCERKDDEGGPDVSLRFEGTAITVECKNVLRQTAADGTARVDFQRTRSSKADPCSRYYAAKDFDLIAACLHAVREEWVFKYALPGDLEAHRSCDGRLASNVRVDTRWSEDPTPLLLSLK